MIAKSTSIKAVLKKRIKDGILDEILTEYKYREEHAEEIIEKLLGRKPYADEVQEYIDGLSGLLDAAEIVYKYGEEDEE